MTDIDEERIRELAYQLWERDGSPEGKSDEYWRAARELLEDEGEVDQATGPAIVQPVPPLPGAGLK